MNRQKNRILRLKKWLEEQVCRAFYEVYEMYGEEWLRLYLHEGKEMLEFKQMAEADKYVDRGTWKDYNEYRKQRKSEQKKNPEEEGMVRDFFSEGFI